MALLAAVTDGRANLLFAKHEAAPGDMRGALEVALSALSGRGGGSAVRAQGSGRADGLETALAEAVRFLSPR